MALRWRGNQVLRNVRRAQRRGVNDTMAAAVIHAKSNHGPGAHSFGRFETQTGALEGSIQIAQPARTTRTGAHGRWGSLDIAYARRVELGFQGKDSAGRVIDQPPYPFLIPAAQAEYPRLAGRIRRYV